YVGLVAGGEIAEFVTKPFLLQSTEVRINAVTEKEGWIRTALLYADGSPIAGYEESLPIRGDSTAHSVQWASSPAQGEPPIGKLVRIRVRAQHATLFSVAVGTPGPYFRFDEGNPARNHLIV